MTGIRNHIGTFFTALLFLVACGAPPEQDQGQAMPTLSGDQQLTKLVPGDGSMEFTVNHPAINRLWGSSDKDIWGVGQAARVVHWDGKVWQRIAVPTGVNLLATWGSSTSDVWAVGEQGVVIHWNGSRWSRVTTTVPDSSALNDIWGTSATDIWAVGDNGVIIHYDGTVWSMVSMAPINDLYTVWALSATEAWIGGDLGLFLHWDGTTWNEVPSGSANPVSHIRGTAANKVWATKQNTDLWNWDGTRWSVITGTGAYGQRIWLTGDSDIWVYYSSGNVYHYNGSVWQSANLNGTVSGVWSSGSTNAWAFVGPDIYHYNGTNWDYRW